MTDASSPADAGTNAARTSWKDLIFPNSLRYRIAIPFIGLVTLVFLILYIVIGRTTERIYLARLADLLHAQVQTAALSITSMERTGNSADDVVAFIQDLGTTSGLRFTLIAKDGSVITDTQLDPATIGNVNSRQEVRDARAGLATESNDISSRMDDDMLYVAVAIANEQGEVVRVAMSPDDVALAVQDAQRLVLVAEFFVLVFTLVAAWFISGKVSEPLVDLKNQANRISSGDFTARVDPSRIEELGLVGRAFNQMGSDLERLTRENKTSALRLESIMAGLVDGVVLTDGDSLVLRMNDAAQRMLGADEADAIGRPFVQVCRDYELAGVLRRAFEGKKNAVDTVEHGLDRMSLMIIARAIDEPDERLGLIVLRDVTELRRLELVRREFVANVSHELRTPLTSIRALVETLEAGAVEEPEFAMQFLARIVSEVDRLNALVEDLLDFARLEAGRIPLEFERVNIGEAIAAGADRLRPQIERARLNLVVDVAPNLPDVEIDVKRIEQVMINLIHNAIKFTPAGGTITVSVSRVKNKIYVVVQDTGVGIEADELSRLFERFYKSDKARRSEGTGLGLAIAKNIVLLHGGEISVESTIGEGATFTFTIPLNQRKARRRARRHTLGLL